MKLLRQGVSLALLGAGLASFPLVQASAADPATDAVSGNLAQRIRDDAQGSVKLSTESATGRVDFVRAGRTGDLMPSTQATSAKGAEAKATAYLDKYGAAFGVADGQLAVQDVTSSDHGWTVTYEQSYRGLPVFGGVLKANLDEAGDLKSVNGYAAPGLDLSVTPRFSESDAAERAVTAVRLDPPGGKETDVSGIEATSNELMVYRLGAVRGETGASVLAYVVEVSNGKNIRDTVFVDANTDKVINRYSMIHDALEREIYEQHFTQADKVFDEGEGDDPADLNTDQRNIYEASGEAYWLFQDTFGRDSYDGEGHTMQVVNNDPSILCPNANWNGATTNYCNGVTSDDVVAHEWGHAYTEYTSGLIYQWQSGALNESYSDVWGETVDLINNRQDEDEPDDPRVVGQCSTLTRGEVELVINSPAGIAGACNTAPASFGPVFDTTGTTADVWVAEDAATGGGTTTDGCTDFTNAADISGKWAYVDRGLCAFTDKIANAEEAGAEGIVFGNNVAGDPISVAGDSELYGVMVSQADGAKFRSNPDQAINVTVTDVGTDPRDESSRWLVSEKSSAFGGAIRDMWNPNCYGDPGKVSDAQYFCGTDDSGGVHSNSGVPNHTFALAVDGGTVDGVAVDGIGLDKAANIWWEAQTNYLTPNSNFTDFANALDSSCVALIGEDINEVSLQPDTPSDPTAPITAADCTDLSAAALATELRKDPAQCDYQPILKPGGPSPCGAQYKTSNVFNEGFSDGLKGWAKSQDIVYPKAKSIPWRSTVYPPDRKSATAYVPDPPEAGDCSGTRTDVSSRDSITSPKITMPNSIRSPKLSFLHYVATEIGFDGGNVRVKVNNGSYKAVPADAFIFNGYNENLESVAAGNTNPMAGQKAWTGTDGNEPNGSWGTTQINLAKLGVGKKDDVRIRFDFGRDGCGGQDGWYVDNVRVTICKNAAKVLGTRQ